MGGCLLFSVFLFVVVVCLFVLFCFLIFFFFTVVNVFVVAPYFFPPGRSQNHIVTAVIGRKLPQ